MAKKKRTGLIVGIVLILAAFFYFGNPFTIGLDTYIPYSHFGAGGIFIDEWEYVGHLPFLTFENGQLIITHLSDSSSVTESTLRTTQDLKGRDFRIFYHAPEIGMQGAELYTRVMVPNSNIACRANLEGQRGSIELVTSILNENAFLLKVNGRNICEVTLPAETPLHLLFEVGTQRRFPGQTFNILRLSEPGYRLPFSCTLGPHDVSVFQTFTPNATIDVFSLQYPPRKICQVLVQRPEGVIPDRNLEVGQLLAIGESINPTELFGPDTLISVLYTVDNSNNILPSFCTPSQVLANGECQSRNTLVNVCTNGIFDLATSACYVQSTVLCSGTTIVEGNQTICRFTPPVGQPCVGGTLNLETGLCTVTLTSQSGQIQCPSGYEVDPTNTNRCISYLEDERSFTTQDVINILIGVAVVAGAVLFFAEGITLLFWITAIIGIGLIIFRFFV